MVQPATHLHAVSFKQYPKEIIFQHAGSDIVSLTGQFNGSELGNWIGVASHIPSYVDEESTIQPHPHALPLSSTTHSTTFSSQITTEIIYTEQDLQCKRSLWLILLITERSSPTANTVLSRFNINITSDTLIFGCSIVLLSHSYFSSKTELKEAKLSRREVCVVLTWIARHQAFIVQQLD